jgi:hypothetical protein
MVVNSRTESEVDQLFARTLRLLGFPDIGMVNVAIVTGFLDTGALGLKIVPNPTVDATAD